MTPKVCILTAGKGSRMGPYASYINKGLLPVDKKAVLSHIIGKFPPDTEFVVATGYLGGQVRDYLAVAHPSARIAFAEVDNFDGPGSGPGYSLLCCKDLLRGPFYFVSCDTLWDGPLPSDLEHNWMGTARVEEAASASYCNFRVRDGLVVSIHDKVRVQGGDGRAFTGLCLIRDCGAFWEGLGSGKLVSGEHQISCGIQAILAKSPVRHYDIDWLDAGTFENYKEAVGRYEDYDFSKTNEFLYICGGSVVKFFADRSIVEKRVAKTKLNPAIFPAIDSVRGQFYGYSFLPGRTLYEENSSGIFGNLLRWLDRELWLPRTVDAGEMRGTCRDFYYEKTLKRLAGYHRKYEGSDVAGVINGVPVPAVSELLGRVPWEDLYSGTPVFMHGDLQFDNILHTGGGKFVLLDWRQDFGGRVEFGDLYYDLAKLYGGIVLNYDLIKKKLISYSEDGETIDFDFAQRHSSAGYLGTLLRFAAGKGWDVRKVRTLVPLIYLNMACLHHYPFDKMLYAFGRLLLAEELERSGKAG